MLEIFQEDGLILRNTIIILDNRHTDGEIVDVLVFYTTHCSPHRSSLNYTDIKNALCSTFKVIDKRK